jgi:hypothetical protein
VDLYSVHLWIADGRIARIIKFQECYSRLVFFFDFLKSVEGNGFEENYNTPTKTYIMNAIYYFKLYPNCLSISVGSVIKFSRLLT